MARKLVWTCDWCGKSFETRTDVVEEGAVRPVEVAIGRVCHDACRDCLAKIAPSDPQASQEN